MPNSNTSSILEARDVSFTYEEGTQALSSVNFSCGAGEFIALLASNGGGKTTLLKVLVSLLNSDSGGVYLRGRAVAKIPYKELYKEIGLVLQNPNDQLFAATVEEDVAFGPRNLGHTEDEVSQRVNKALKQVGAEKLRDRAIHHLSFGEQKRVSLAGVLAMQPSVLVLDEPTAGLDPAGEAEMLQLLGELNKEHGLTVMMATHSVDMLPLFADRVYVLKGGRILKEGTPQTVFSDEDVVSEAGLRLPHISRLVRELKDLDGVPVSGLPLTIREARVRLVELVPPEALSQRWGDQHEQ